MNHYSKPRLKPQVELCSIDRKIYFFHRPEVGMQLEDSSGFIASVCKLIDGNKNIDELTEYLTPL